MARIDVLGAGIVGVWQALTLVRRGHEVTLRDPAGLPSARAASALAGAMLAPYCEGEAGHELVRDLGLRALPLWLEAYPDAVRKGSLVVAMPRDQSELARFAAITEGHRWLAEADIAALEPALAGRFSRALYYAEEAHVQPDHALSALSRLAIAEGLRFANDAADDGAAADWVVDCRGLAARDELKTLRGVRGERLVIEMDGRETMLSRPVRLLHPRIPFYIVPWAEGRLMIGATVIESEDAGRATLRSVMELLGAAYALLPAFGESRVLQIDAGVRPAFPDNLPKILVRGARIFVNGLYRHGFLLSPVLAALTADYIETGARHEGVVFEDHGEW